MSLEYYRVGELRFLSELKLSPNYYITRQYLRKTRPLVEDMKYAIKSLLPFDTGHDFIRLGGASDGAYLIPDDLSGIAACFSPGVNNFKNFEDDLLNFGIKSHMCDFSSKLSNFQTPLNKDMQTFQRLWLEPESSDDSISLSEWVNSLEPDSGDLLLQMDIEGAEYRNLLELPLSTLSRFRIIVIELHGLDWIGWSNFFLKAVLLPVLTKLQDMFVVSHVHPNNVTGAINIYEDVSIPKLLEVTFLRKDRVKIGGILNQTNVPHPLDIKNVSNRPSLLLGKPWKK